MPTLQIRNLPKDLAKKLKDEAKRCRRSVQQQAIFALKRGLRPRLSGRLRRARILDDLRRMRAHWPSGLPDPVELIREDRAR